MEPANSAELWGLAVAASCLCSWILGGIHGAARAHVQRDANRSRGGDFFTLKIAPNIAPVSEPGKFARLKRSVRQETLSEANLDAIRAERVKARRDVFADMPPLCELRAQAKAILNTSNVWDEDEACERLYDFRRAADPTSLGLLQHHRDAVKELRRVNTHRIVGQPSVPSFDQLPRLTDVAPLAPESSMAELACQFEERIEVTMPRSRYASSGLR